MLNVRDKDIKLLSDEELTQLLKILLHLESDAHGIFRSASDVSLNIKLRDGGQDGSIHWEGGVDQTPFIPSRFTIFQCKATSMEKSACKKELKTTKGGIKPKIKEVLDANGSYVFFCGHSSNEYINQPKIEAIREELKNLGYGNSSSLDIKYYDANKIADWVNNYLAAIIYVMGCCGQSIPHNIKTWEDWSRHDKDSFEYVSNESLDEKIKAIQTAINKEKTIIRITGLSGLGKTRLALEAFRPPDDENDIEQVTLSQKVLYVDASSDGSKLPAFITMLNRKKISGILVVDDCEKELHHKLINEIETQNSQLSLLTLDYEPEETNIEYIFIELTQEDCKGIVKGIIEQLHPNMKSIYISRIEEFSQNFPSIATHLATQVESEAENIGQLNGSVLLNKLLFGRNTSDDKRKKVLQACSLFSRFEFSEDSETSDMKCVRWISGDISETDFFEICKEYINRKILQIRGRYIHVVPKPLAITLAAEWWDNRSKQVINDTISKIESSNMSPIFCEQVKYLDFSPKARELTEDLCGTQGPFGNAEVLLTDEGSLLFRSFAVVNPQATTVAINRVVTQLTNKQLLEVKNNVRRNLVWALENLCWWADTFPVASRVMLKFAVAENESWGNNATGQFLQLFHIYLPGTKADLSERLNVLKECVVSDEKEKHELGIKALGKALTSGHFSRNSQVAEQGSKVPQADYAPSGKEIFGYWKQCLELLAQQACEEEQYSELAKDMIATHLRTLISEGMIDVIETIMVEIIQQKGAFWPDALTAIRHSLNYEGPQMPSDIKVRVQALEKLLLPNDLENKLRLYVSIPDWLHVEDENGELIDIAEIEAKKLAEELSNDDSWYNSLGILLEGEQRQAYSFGKRLGELIRKPEVFIDKATLLLARIPEAKANISILGAFLAGLNNRELISSTLDRIVQSDDLVVYSVKITSYISITKDDLERLAPLIHNNKIPIEEFHALSYGRPLEGVKDDDVFLFCKQIVEHSIEGAMTALHVLYMYCYRNEDRIKLHQVEFKEILRLNGLLKVEHKHQLGTHYWKSIAISLLQSDKRDDGFALHLINEIIDVCSEKEYSTPRMESSLKDVLKELLVRYADIIWPVIGNSILSDNYYLRIQVNELLGIGHGEKEGGNALLFDSVSHDMLIEWCRENMPTAPVRISEYMPLFSGKKDEPEWHPFALRIIDEFGDIGKVRNEIRRNMWSFLSCGSRSPYYERRRKLMEHLFGHKLNLVQKWAKECVSYLDKDIQEEKRGEEEQELGVY